MAMVSQFTFEDKYKLIEEHLSQGDIVYCG